MAVRFFLLLSAGVQTSTEIEELSLRTPCPVAIYLCESKDYSGKYFLREGEATATNVSCATAVITPRR